jgi:hypothetical protein
MLIKKVITFLAFLISVSGRAQMPETDIWLYEIKKTPSGIILHKGLNITNRPGYDNQPHFSPDNKQLYFVSVKEDKQADVYSYNIGNKKTLQLTHTPESEYSPTVSPDRKSLVCVVVLSDSSQIILPLDIKTGYASVYPDHKTKFEDKQISAFDSVGYFSFLNSDTVLYYKLTGIHSLRAHSISKGSDVLIAENITRSFRPAMKNNFFYVVKGEKSNVIRLYDIYLKKSEEYAVAKAENEDFIWDKSLGLIKSDGSKLMRYNAELKTWIELGDFSAAGISRITRFTISPNGRFLALVSNK